MIGFTNFDNFLTGSPITYTADGFITTTFLQGDANRYYRSNESGWYSSGQVSDSSQPQHQRRSSLRLSRRPEGKERPHFQFRSVALQLRRRHRHHHFERLHRRGKQSRLPHQGRQRFDSDRAAMGTCAAPRASPGARRCSTTKSWSAQAGACTTIAANSSPIFPRASPRA